MTKLKVNNGKIMDGGKQVGMIKNGSIYDRNNTSSSYLLAMTKNNVIYNRNNSSASYCIGMVKNGILNGSKHNARLTPRIKLMKKR